MKKTPIYLPTAVEIFIMSSTKNIGQHRRPTSGTPPPPQSTAFAYLVHRENSLEALVLLPVPLVVGRRQRLFVCRQPLGVGVTDLPPTIKGRSHQRRSVGDRWEITIGDTGDAVKRSDSRGKRQRRGGGDTPESALGAEEQLPERGVKIAKTLT